MFTTLTNHLNIGSLLSKSTFSQKVLSNLISTSFRLPFFAPIPTFLTEFTKPILLSHIRHINQIHSHTTMASTFTSNPISVSVQVSTTKPSHKNLMRFSSERLIFRPLLASDFTAYLAIYKPEGSLYDIGTPSPATRPNPCRRDTSPSSSSAPSARCVFNGCPAGRCLRSTFHEGSLKNGARAGWTFLEGRSGCHDVRHGI